MGFFSRLAKCLALAKLPRLFMRFLRIQWLLVVLVLWGPLPKGQSAKRVPWDGSQMASSPIPAPLLVTERAFQNLKFQQPVEIRFNKTLNRFFVLELGGKLFSFPPDPNVQQADLVYDLKANVLGARQSFGFEFHPKFAENRELFLCYVFQPKRIDGTHVARLKMPSVDGLPQVDPGSREVLITWLSGGHNGGSLNFGPDGMLYISSGDAEAPYPPDGLKTGQDISDLLASILRIDINHRDPDQAYSIPPDNPFVGVEGARPEVWAYGFRNPWRMSVDKPTGNLWVGDVGWDLWELVFKVERGGNYGWSIMEGSQPIHPDDDPGPVPITSPIVQHSHSEARSMTGGHIYHGSRLAGLRGAYIYGDYTTGRIWGLRYDGKQVTEHRELANTPHQIICFGIGPDAEFIVVDHLGTLNKLVPNPASTPAIPFPTQLSGTGLFSDLPKLTPAAGVMPYTINAVPWQDGACYSRVIAIPGNGVIDLHPSNDSRLGNFEGSFRFPNKTVLAKTITMDVFDSPDSSQPQPQKLETQVLQLVDGFWQAYSFVWNEKGTDAELSDGKGSDIDLLIPDPLVPGGRRELGWHFASRAECQLCHGQRFGTVIGFTPEQLGEAITGQLQETGIVAKAPPNPRPALAKPNNSDAPLAKRARAYLHANCAHCHHQGGGGATVFDLSNHLPFQQTKLVGLPPAQGDFRLDEARVIAPGDPYRSVLLYRMAKQGNGRMPHIGSNRIDTVGLKLIHDWIADMPLDEAGRSAKRLGQVNTQQKQIHSLSFAKGNHNAASLVSLLAEPSGALMLQQSVLGNNPLGQTVADKRDAISRVASGHDDFRVRELFEQFLPDSERTKKLGPKPNTTMLLNLAGSTVKGRNLFLQTGRTLCISCHRVQGSGKNIGPDLSQVGSRLNREQLLESLLEPAKTITEGYSLYSLEMKSGEIQTGFLLERAKEKTRFRLLSGEELTMPIQSVQRFTDLPISAMPAGLLQNLAPQEAADLLAYLVSLR